MKTLNTPELIRRKREGRALDSEEIFAFLDGYVKGTVPDYQMSAFLMAVFFRGMELDEAAMLTRVMIHSGRTYDLSDIEGPKVDKHSTGGVGDKVSLILAPLAASLGVIVPMVSGRALGHTGGTLDKLDSIPGYRWALTEEEFKNQLKRIGCAIIGQTDDFVPADKKLYSLRDVTATVESIPLICASILSKKAASGTQALLMDVKTGSGAFMPTYEKSRELAQTLVQIGKVIGMPTVALLTRMDQPLGTTVGNALEVREVLEVLQGKGPADTRALTIRQCAEMLVLGGLQPDLATAEKKSTLALDSGRALEHFIKWIEAQGGVPDMVDMPEILEISQDKQDFLATESGFLISCDTRKVGVAANVLGAGRINVTDKVDHGVGFTVHKKPGDSVEKGEPLLTIHHRGGRGLEECLELLKGAYQVKDQTIELMPLIVKRIDS